MARCAALIACCAALGIFAAEPVAVVRIDAGIYAVRLAEKLGGETPLAPARAAFIVGPRGVAIIDSGLSWQDGAAIVAAVRRVTSAPIRIALLTHPSQEAIFGAAAFQAQGIPVAMHADAAALMAGRCDACLQGLVARLGAERMARTRVAVPDRLVADGERLELIGRPLRVIAPPWSSAPGAIAILDERSATLFAGSIAAVRAVPDTRDGEPAGWREALGLLAATRCRHLVPAYGPPGRCADIRGFVRYLDELDARVAALMGAGVGLGELDSRCELPRYAGWERYAALHRANASRAYLRLERAAFDTIPQ
jgi:glyoxylase-like metal-dependent hydrolase (beta-lactamase superfamily II)